MLMLKQKLKFRLKSEVEQYQPCLNEVLNQA